MEMRDEGWWKISDVMCQADKGESRLSNRQDKEGNCREWTRYTNQWDEGMISCLRAPPILAIQPSMETIDGIEEQSKHRDIKTQASGDEWYGMNEP